MIISDLKSSLKDYHIRIAARGVMFKGKSIALMYVANKRFHKLPGGGLESGESLAAGLKRELLEETGCKARLTGDVGLLIEERSRYKLLQISYCFLAKVIGEPRKQALTEKEAKDGFSVKWVSLKEAIRLVSYDKAKDYESRFIKKRDLWFLKKAKTLINH